MAICTSCGVFSDGAAEFAGSANGLAYIVQANWSESGGKILADRSLYEAVQVDAFSTLVNDGTYSASFTHAAPMRRFFSEVVTAALAELRTHSASGMSVIDCGCGNGAWLDQLTELPGAGRIGALYGFDLTPEMIDVAVERLGSKSLSADLCVGNILDERAYYFGDSQRRFDLAYSYDVVQQLPANSQFAAVEMLLGRLKPGGIAIIFDNDRNSSFGHGMSRKKFFTRYLGMNLVPRYYCNARYPALGKFAERLSTSNKLRVGVELSPGGGKRALIIRAEG